MSIGNGTIEARPERLEQLLALQEQLLLGDAGVHALGTRVCQSTALLLGAAAARLGTLRPGDLEVSAAYGAGRFPALDPERLRGVVRDRRPMLSHGDADEPTLLTLPLDVGEPPALLQVIDRPEHRFAADDVALARYAASLASVALRLAGSRQRSAGAGGGEAFVALSHDLRQPLNVMLGYTRLLLEGAYGPCGEEQAAILATVERHALEMHTLLNGALDLAQAERALEPAALGDVAIADLLTELCSGSLAHRVPEGVTLGWTADVGVTHVRTDRFRVRQMLQNLVDNALRYTRAGAVSIDAARTAEGIRFVVEDTGPGIDAATLAVLFTPFRPGATPGASGRGCGLYLVKRFAESLGGRVSVDSALGAGTRFVIEIPAAG